MRGRKRREGGRRRVLGFSWSLWVGGRGGVDSTCCWYVEENVVYDWFTVAEPPAMGWNHRTWFGRVCRVRSDDRALALASFCCNAAGFGVGRDGQRKEGHLRVLVIGGTLCIIFVLTAADDQTATMVHPSFPSPARCPSTPLSPQSVPISHLLRALPPPSKNVHNNAIPLLPLPLRNPLQPRKM